MQTGETTDEYRKARDETRRREDRIAAKKRQQEMALSASRQGGQTGRQAMIEAGKNTRTTKNIQAAKDAQSTSKGSGFTPLQTANMRKDIYNKLQPVWKEKSLLNQWTNPRTGKALSAGEIRQNQDDEVTNYMERYTRTSGMAQPAGARPERLQRNNLQSYGSATTEGGRRFEVGSDNRIHESRANSLSSPLMSPAIPEAIPEAPLAPTPPSAPPLQSLPSSAQNLSSDKPQNSLSGYTNPSVQGSYLWGEKDGQPQRLFQVEAPEIKKYTWSNVNGQPRRSRTKQSIPNPNYQEYLKKLDQIGM